MYEYIDIMRVGVVMFYDDAIKEYGDNNYAINKKYCDKYKLDIILSQEKTYQNRHASWERLPLILKHIEKYDYLIWIDADAYFYYDAGNIVDFIQEQPNDNFIFSNDMGNRNINSGFFIVKNCEYSRQFLQKWAYDEELYINNPYPIWWDQGVLCSMIEQNILDIKNNASCHEYGIMQHFDKDYLVHSHKRPYVFHMAGRTTNERIIESNKYYDMIL